MAPNLPACSCIAVGLLFSAAAAAQTAALAPPPCHEGADLERLPETALKMMYLSCARVSSQRLLSLDEATRCSTAADVLKRRSFGGDFNAMLAWWRRHRDEQ
jgi:hypothetical protein